MPRLQKMAHGISSISPLGAGMVTGSGAKASAVQPGHLQCARPQKTLYLNGAHLDEVYPVSIPTHYLALNITISGYRDSLGFGYIACRRSVPALQRMLDYTHNAITELEAAHSPQPALYIQTTRNPGGWSGQSNCSARCREDHQEETCRSTG
jgi:diacylglycerol O-acyltransferase